MSAMPALVGKDPRSRSELILATAVLGVVALLVMPLPAFALDAFLAMSIGISLLVLLVALGVARPLDFSVFPSLLLIVTLFRLGLNVATTRLILLDGASGTGSAGHINQAFGQFAVGGSLIVGSVVFLILLVVNFAVITRGSGRVAEVAARFTLDALPGKQMSIDADLAAGMIDDTEARRRRANLEQEIEFFGAMDGASKFVRGDAIAGLVITCINIAAGLIVTRASSGAKLGAELGAQVFGQKRTLKHAAVVLSGIGLLPGMPLIAFLTLAGLAFVLSRRQPSKPVPSAEAQAAAAAGPKQETLGSLIDLDTLELEVGHGLLSIIDLERGGELPGRVTALRKQIAGELGLVIPAVHLRDNLRLDANEYRIKLRGLDLSTGIAYVDRVMALDPAGAGPRLDGVDALSAKEPAFGLPALWIFPGERSRAARAGDRESNR